MKLCENLQEQVPFVIKVAARSSKLSLIQVAEVANELAELGLLIEFDSILTATRGDLDRTTSLKNMEKSDFFTPMIIQMIAIGEEIGELSNMLKRIAKFYQEYLETFVTRLATIFEPVMIVFMGIMIGAMVISIFMPIFSIATIKTT